MKIKLPEGLKKFDIPTYVLRRLPSHLAWYKAGPIRNMDETELRFRDGHLRPFTTLEVWLIQQGVECTRLRTAYFLCSAGCKYVAPRSSWQTRLVHGSPMLTGSPLPLWQTNKKRLIAWLAEHKLVPPPHIFSPANDFVAEELPTPTSTYINTPATHAN